MGEREQCKGLVEMSGQIPWNSKQRWGCWPRLLILDEPLPPLDIDSVLPPAFLPQTPRSLEGEFCSVGQNMGQDIDGRDWKATRGGSAGPGGHKRLGLEEAALSCTWWVLGILGLCSHSRGWKWTFRPHVPPPVYLLIPKPHHYCFNPIFPYEHPKVILSPEEVSKLPKSHVIPDLGNSPSLCAPCQKTNTSFS